METGDQRIQIAHALVALFGEKGEKDAVRRLSNAFFIVLSSSTWRVCDNKASSLSEEDLQDISKMMVEYIFASGQELAKLSANERMVCHGIDVMDLVEHDSQDFLVESAVAEVSKVKDVVMCRDRLAAACLLRYKELSLSEQFFDLEYALRWMQMGDKMRDASSGYEGSPMALISALVATAKW